MRTIPSAGSPSANSSKRIVSGPPSWRTTQAFTGGRLAETGPPRQVVQQRPDEDQGDGCPVDLRERAPLGRPDVDEGDRAAKPQQRQVDEKARVADLPERDRCGVAVLDELAGVAPVLFGGQRRNGFGGDRLALLLLTRDALDLGGVDPGRHTGLRSGDRQGRRWGRRRGGCCRHGRHCGTLSREWLPAVAVEAPLAVFGYGVVPARAVPKPVAVVGPPCLGGLDRHQWARLIMKRAAPATAASSAPAAIMKMGARPANTEPRRPMRGGFGRSPDGLGTSASTTRSAGALASMAARITSGLRHARGRNRISVPSRPMSIRVPSSQRAPTAISCHRMLLARLSASHTEIPDGPTISCSPEPNAFGFPVPRRGRASTVG